MDEAEFANAADDQLARIEAALDRLADGGDVDIDVESKPGGVIEIECTNAEGETSKVIINRHMAAREIWVAARSGGFHFRCEDHHAARWRGTRDGEELMTAVSRVLGEQCGVPVSF